MSSESDFIPPPNTVLVKLTAAEAIERFGSNMVGWAVASKEYSFKSGVIIAVEPGRTGSDGPRPICWKDAVNGNEAWASLAWNMDLYVPVQALESRS